MQSFPYLAVWQPEEFIGQMPAVCLTLSSHWGLKTSKQRNTLLLLSFAFVGVLDCLIFRFGFFFLFNVNQMTGLGRISQWMGRGISKKKINCLSFWLDGCPAFLTCLNYYHWSFSRFSSSVCVCLRACMCVCVDFRSKCMGGKNKPVINCWGIVFRSGRP